MPMWTPPLTPAQGHGNTHSASSSVSGVPGVSGNQIRRESESEREDAVSTSASKKRELQSVPEAEEGRDGKRRRIAPTLVSVGSATVEAGESAIVSSTEENTPTAQTPAQQPAA